MILKRSLLLDNTPTDGNGSAPVSPSNPSVGPTPAPTPAPSGPKGFTPQVSRPVPDAMKKVEFKMDDSLFENKPEIKDPTKPNIDPIVEPVRTAAEANPPTAVQPKPATPPSAKPVAEKPVVAPAPAPDDGPIVPRKKGSPQEPVKEFDYSGFQEEEAQALRQMSTAGRDFTISLIKKTRELEANKTGIYAQHPNAYVLDPTFQKLQEDMLYVNKEAEYWQSQLAKIKAGEEWQPVTGWDAKGNPVVGEKRKPTTLDEEQVRLAMNRCYGAAEQKNQEANQYVATHQQRVKQDFSNIRAERARRFGWVANPEILKETVELDNGQEQTVQQIRDTAIRLFPSYMQGTEPVEVVADLFAALQVLRQELREARSAGKVAEKKVAEVARAEPTGGSRGGGADPSKSINGVKTFSLEGLPR